MEKRESKYIELISQCKITLEQIRGKVDIIISPSVPRGNSPVAVESKTILEENLIGLLCQMEDLRDNIVV
jgi:hypothetical protein